MNQRQARGAPYFPCASELMHCECALLHTDPMVIVPVYSSGLFNDEARLVFCLVAHPLILEFCLHMCRQNSVATYDRDARAVGHDPGRMHDLNERELFVEETMHH